MSADASATSTPLLLDEPFRLLFPVGAVGAIAGVATWVAFGLGWSDSYDARAHMLLQICGFELAFAAGFLMTVVPRFLESLPTRRWELFAAASIAVTTIVALGLGQVAAGAWGGLSLGTLLALFCLRRLRHRADDPPPYFAFLPAALLAAVAGPALVLHPLPGWPHLGEMLVGQGVLLPLVLAIGSHLGPRLLHGHRGFPETTTPAAHRRLALVGLGGLLLLATFPLAVKYPTTGLALRAALVSAYLLGVLRLYRTPWQPWPQLHLMRWSFLSLCAGLWWAAADPFGAAAALHLTFLGGFGLLTMIVALRVVTGHCDREAWWDGARPAVWLPAGLVALALPVRLVADVLPAARSAWLALAGLLWAAAWVLWLALYLPRLGPSYVTPD